MHVLVTGCGGFLGSEIVRQLIARGDRVTGVARRVYPQLESLGMARAQGDLANPRFVSHAFRNVDAVIHTAAKAGVWGSWGDYYKINKQATDYVIDACHREGIRSLVFTSSPSVTFDGGDQSGVDESVPYAQRWLCHYPHTKALAEQAVLKAHEPGRLSTLALRPHLIWGDSDPHILPRILERARSGRLRIIGDGKNRVDTVHVTNAAAAHLDALDSLAKDSPSCGGQAYFITQDEPVSCWEWISQICEIGRVPPPKKKISFEAAYRVGGILELVYRISMRTSEPPMTRFVAAQLARDHYFNISRARSRLGYAPRVNLEQGLRGLREAWGSLSPSS